MRTTCLHCYASAFGASLSGHPTFAAFCCCSLTLCKYFAIVELFISSNILFEWLSCTHARSQTRKRTTRSWHVIFLLSYLLIKRCQMLHSSWQVDPMRNLDFNSRIISITVAILCSSDVGSLQYKLPSRNAPACLLQVWGYFPRKLCWDQELVIDLTFLSRQASLSLKQPLQQVNSPARSLLRKHTVLVHTPVACCLHSW